MSPEWTILRLLTQDGRNHSTQPALGLDPIAGKVGYYQISRQETEIVRDIYKNSQLASPIRQNIGQRAKEWGKV